MTWYDKWWENMTERFMLCPKLPGEGIIPWVRSWMRSKSSGQLHQLGVHPQRSLLHVQWQCLRWTNFSLTSCHRVTDNCATSISSSFWSGVSEKWNRSQRKNFQVEIRCWFGFSFVGHKSLNLRSRCGWGHIFLQFSLSLDLPWQSWCSVDQPLWAREFTEVLVKRKLEVHSEDLSHGTAKSWQFPIMVGWYLSFVVPIRMTSCARLCPRKALCKIKLKWTQNVGKPTNHTMSKGSGALVGLSSRLYTIIRDY